MESCLDCDVSASQDSARYPRYPSKSDAQASHAPLAVDMPLVEAEARQLVVEAVAAVVLDLGVGVGSAFGLQPATVAQATLPSSQIAVLLVRR